eukprot:2926870-Amphidinium_carterae.1
MSHPPSGTPLPNLILNPGGALPQNPLPQGAHGSTESHEQGGSPILQDRDDRDDRADADADADDDDDDDG